MSKLEESIKYFIEYESHNRLNSSKLSKTAVLVDSAIFLEINKLKRYISERKKEAIINALSFHLSKLNTSEKSNICSEVIELRKETLLEYVEAIKTIVFSHDLSIKTKDEHSMIKVANILMNDQINILYPTYQINKETLHLISFICHIQENVLMVKEFRINRDLLEKMHLKKSEIGIDEILGGESAVREYFEAIHSINLTSFLECKHEIVRKIVLDFPNIEEELTVRSRDVALVTLDEFEDVMYPPFKEDLRHLLTLRNFSEVPLVSKYILQNKDAVHVDEIHPKIHFGSYTDKYAINQKQWNVLSGIEQSELLAVSGPPGTGKTTLLKEIISHVLVKKTRKLIDQWHKEWREHSTSKGIVYISPLEGVNEGSIIVTSTNNEAVDNIGIEVTNEINRLRGALGLQLKYDFSAKLGRTDNKKLFYKGAYSELLSILSEEEQPLELNEGLYIDEFNRLEKDLLEANKKIDVFKKAFDRLRCNALLVEKNNLIFNDGISENMKSLMIKIEEVKQLIRFKFNEVEIIQREIIRISEDIDDQRNEIKKTVLLIDANTEKIKEINLKRKQIVFRAIHFILSKFEHVNTSILNRLTGDLDLYISKEEALNKKKQDLEKILNGYEAKYINKIDEEKQVEDIIKSLERDSTSMIDKISVYKDYFYALELVKLLIPMDYNLSKESMFYKICNSPAILQMRFRLFELSLILNEYYILKNQKYFKKNLKFMLDSEGKIMSDFYRSSCVYSDEVSKSIRCLWETFSIVFPVITTTLHSFSKDNFHMLDKLFDYILIDEAGQILPYYLVAPLYRCNHAVIVGDEKQLEPIRDLTIKVYENYEEKIPNSIDINKTTCQGLANLASGFYEIDKDESTCSREGIMLEEHRRCERSIVQFSNQYVYNNRMTILNEDQEKSYLKYNACFLDIRGVQSIKNINMTEVHAIKALVDKLLLNYKSEDIAVIAPYINQVLEIKNALLDTDVKVGTVHSFQGKDKEVVIFSLTVDSIEKQASLRFIGDKPNLLNVAFTRAKQQLIVVGNFSVLEECNASNYLNKAGKYFKTYGGIFSIYEEESKYWDNLSVKLQETYLALIQEISFTPSMKYNKLFKPFTNEARMLEDKNHYPFLLSLFDNASKKVEIVSPWITESIVNADFLTKLKAFKAINKEYVIVFGHKENNENMDSIEGIKKIVLRDDHYADKTNPKVNHIVELRSILGDKLINKPPIHTKALIIDDEFLLIGSHNWLAKKGERKNASEELTIISQDKDMIQYVKKKYKLG